MMVMVSATTTTTTTTTTTIIIIIISSSTASSARRGWSWRAHAELRLAGTRRPPSWTMVVRVGAEA